MKYETKHFLRKLWSTARILVKLGMARTFGRYEYSAHDSGVNYARYHWRGKIWHIPTTPVEK